MSRGEPELVTGFWASPAKTRSRWPLVRQPGRDCSRQVKCDQLLTWPSDQPRHATIASGYPVESSSPPSGSSSGGTCTPPLASIVNHTQGLGPREGKRNKPH